MALNADDFLSLSLDSSAPEAEIGTIGSAPSFAAIQAHKTSKKNYRDAYIYINVTSHSQIEVLQDCARKFQISKSPAHQTSEGIFNIDFVFGHAVGAGVQAYLATNSPTQAQLASMLAWNIDLDAEFPKKGKSSPLATLAVEKFIQFWKATYEDEWEIALLNGKPATELTFWIDFENGYFHAGHIDVVLRHRVTHKLMVVEIKTTAIRSIDEAQYGNSEQALGYSLVVDRIAESTEIAQNYNVVYFVYSSTNREWQAMPFIKNRTQRLEWLQARLLNHANIGTFRKISFFPKNGSACWSFSSRCPHYGLCDMKSMQRTDFRVFDSTKDPMPEAMDFTFKLSELATAVLREPEISKSI
jgi:hypothetical protein